MKLITNVFGAVFSTVIGTLGTAVSIDSEPFSPNDWFGMALVGIAVVLFIGVMKDL